MPTIVNSKHEEILTRAYEGLKNILGIEGFTCYDVPIGDDHYSPLMQVGVFLQHPDFKMPCPNNNSELVCDINKACDRVIEIQKAIAALYGLEIRGRHSLVTGGGVQGAYIGFDFKEGSICEEKSMKKIGAV